MKKITTILFDVDGTLLDTKELIFRAFEHTFETQSTHIPLRADFNRVVGKPLTICYQILTGENDVEKYTKTHHEFQLQHIALSRAFDNSLQTLQKLKAEGYKTAAVTSRKKKTTRQTLEAAGLLKYLDFAVYADEVENHKPHPEPLEKALHALSSTPIESLMVGDSEADILGGKNTGTKTAGALYGFHGEALREYGPDFLLEDIKDVLEVVRGVA